MTRRRAKGGGKTITVHHKRNSFKITVKVVPKRGKSSTTKKRSTTKRKKPGQFKRGGGRIKRRS